MVKSCIKDLKDYVNLLEEVKVTTEEAGDDVSNDLVLTIKADVEKDIWMLQAFLGNEATANL